MQKTTIFLYVYSVFLSKKCHNTLFFAIFFALNGDIFDVIYKKGENMGRKILVTSGKGGVGKTTISCGLAKALASANATVCVVDADIGLNNLDLLMNIENRVVYDIVDCMQGKCQIKQALVKDKFFDNLYTLPAGKQQPHSVVYDFTTIIDKVASIFDFVIVDSPAGIENGFLTASRACREAIVVVTPHIASLRDANKIISYLISDKSKTNVFVAINRIRGDLVVEGKMMNHGDISNLLKCDVVGVVPESDTFNISNTLDMAYGQDEMCLSMKTLAQNLINDSRNIFDYTKKYKGIGGIIRRKLKRL